MIYIKVKHSFLHKTCILYFLCPKKPLELREAKINASQYKVCVLGLWAEQEAEGKRLVELANALESGR